LLTQIDNMYAGLRNDLEAAEVENKRLVGANLAELLRIKEAADVLYSEAEEYDLPDGLGMGASQQYWDDLANALFPDDSGEVIQADLENVQAAVDGAWEAFNEELNKPEFLPCGHHHSMMLKSAETGEPLYCELCDCISRRNDFQTERDEARAEAAALRVDAERVCPPIGRYVVDHIASEGMLNPAGGIYATSIYDFAYEIQKAFSESNRIAFPDDTAAIEARKEGV
jgi:hypothetical protein